MNAIAKILRTKGFYVQKITQFVDETEITGWILLHEEVVVFYARCTSFVKIYFASIEHSSQVRFDLPYYDFEQRFSLCYSVLPQLILGAYLPNQFHVATCPSTEPKYQMYSTLVEDSQFLDCSEYITLA